MKATVKIKCTSKSGQIGTFLVDNNNIEISPVFGNTCLFTSWIMKAYPNRRQTSINVYEL